MKQGDFTQHFPDSLFKVGEKGLFSLELLLELKTLKVGKHECQLILHNKKDQDVEGATVRIKILKDGVPFESENPLVTKDVGMGCYEIKDLALTKGSGWQLRIEVEKDQESDSAIFALPEVQ